MSHPMSAVQEARRWLRTAPSLAVGRRHVVQLLDKYDELRDHILDAKRFGLRADLNPTRKVFATAEEADAWWSGYLRGIDRDVRESAARILAGGEKP